MQLIARPQGDRATVSHYQAIPRALSLALRKAKIGWALSVGAWYGRLPFAFRSALLFTQRCFGFFIL